MRHKTIIAYCSASSFYTNLLLAFLVAGAIFLNGCGMPMGRGPHRYYQLPADRMMELTKKASSQIGFSIWKENTDHFTTDWQTYSVGERGWLWWKKEWKHRTRLTVFITERNSYQTEINVTSETEDSPANKDQWNVVSRPTEREQNIIRNFLNAVDKNF